MLSFQPKPDGEGDSLVLVVCIYIKNKEGRYYLMRRPKSKKLCAILVAMVMIFQMALIPMVVSANPAAHMGVTITEVANSNPNQISVLIDLHTLVPGTLWSGAAFDVHYDSTRLTFDSWEIPAGDPAFSTADMVAAVQANPVGGNPPAGMDAVRIIRHNAMAQQTTIASAPILLHFNVIPNAPAGMAAIRWTPGSAANHAGELYFAEPTPESFAVASTSGIQPLSGFVPASAFAATVTANTWEAIRDAVNSPAATQPGGVHIIVSGPITAPTGAAGNAITIGANRNVTISGAAGQVRRVEQNNMGQRHFIVNGANASLTLSGGVMITRSWAYPGVNNGGVSVLNGTFNMEGGSLQNLMIGMDNSAPVLVQGANSTFNMSGGIISGNLQTHWMTSSFNAVLVRNRGTFNMSGGAIQDNSHPADAGAVRAVGVTGAGSQFNMSGDAVIQRNHGRGAVQVNNEARFEMHGGTITDNVSRQLCGGAIRVASSATFEMFGGTISNNRAPNNGGGVNVTDLGTTFIMHGGVIEGNTVTGTFNGSHTNGGGGIASTRSTVHIHGGTIRNNTAHNGAGILINNSGTDMGADAVRNAERFTVAAGVQFYGNVANAGSRTPPTPRPANIATTASVSVHDHALNNFDIGYANVVVTPPPPPPPVTVARFHSPCFNGGFIDVPITVGQPIPAAQVPATATRYGTIGNPGRAFMGWFTTATPTHVPGNRTPAFNLGAPVTQAMMTGNILHLHGSWLQYGDLNGDGSVNMLDHGLLHMFVAGFIPASEIITETADVNVDGVINMMDHGLLHMFVLGMPVILGVPAP